jgi:hypothetical protein
MSKPRIKFNGGNPVALCNECSVITNYVSINDDDSVTIADTEYEVPELCAKCAENQAIEKAKAIIKSCETQEHFNAAVKYLDQYLTVYHNAVIYKDLLELIQDRKQDINLKKD